MKVESAPQGCAPEVIFTAQEKNQLQVTTDVLGPVALLERLVTLQERVDALEAERYCERCTQPPPPRPRWPGDLWARDDRKPHSCGKPGRSR